MRGKWFGVGVGPGDPELMTIKAARILRECGCIAIPGKTREECVSYGIAVQAVPEIGEKPYLCLSFPMTKDRERLMKSHREAAERIAVELEKGISVAFLTLGDSTVYSTCLYVLEYLKKDGFEGELVNGIPSFCSVASRLGIPLVNGSEELHIIPASYQIEDALGLPGVKVLMKAGRKLPEVKKRLREAGCCVTMVENCGMKGERIYRSLEEIPEEAGYFSLFIVR